MSDTVEVVEWEWSDSESGMVVLDGLNEDGEKVAERVFKQTTTNVIDEHGDHRKVEDDGSWGLSQEFEVPEQ